MGGASIPGVNIQNDVQMHGFPRKMIQETVGFPHPSEYEGKYIHIEYLLGSMVKFINYIQLQQCRPVRKDSFPYASSLY